MKLTIAIPHQNRFLDTEVPEEFTLEEFRAYVEAETGVLLSYQTLEHPTVALDDHATDSLGLLGLKEDDVIVLQDKPRVATPSAHSSSFHVSRLPSRPSSRSSHPVSRPPSRILSRPPSRAQSRPLAQSLPQSRPLSPRVALASPVEEKKELDLEFEQLRQQALVNPGLRLHLTPAARAALSNPQEFRDRMLQAAETAGLKYPAEIMQLQQNPDHPEAQQKLLEMIRRERIQENLRLAYEITPEAFVKTTLLLIKLSIKGHETHALVDSGAQTSLILESAAESFGLQDLIDPGFASMAKGVGTQESPGRIHSVPVVLGNTNLALPCSFLVLEVGFPVLLGLDMLKAHRCIIDLSKNALVVGSFEISFLSEREVELLVLEGHNVKPTSAAGSEALLKLAHGPAERALLQGSQLGTNVAAAVSALGLKSLLLPRPTVPHARRPTSKGKSLGNATEDPNEESINQLRSLGFTRIEVVDALRLSHGNVDIAAAYLFQ